MLDVFPLDTSVNQAKLRKPKVHNTVDLLVLWLEKIRHIPQMVIFSHGRQ